MKGDDVEAKQVFCRRFHFWNILKATLYSVSLRALINVLSTNSVEELKDDLRHSGILETAINHLIKDFKELIAWPAHSPNSKKVIWQRTQQIHVLSSSKLSKTWMPTWDSLNTLHFWIQITKVISSNHLLWHHYWETWCCAKVCKYFQRFALIHSTEFIEKWKRPERPIPIVDCFISNIRALVNLTNNKEEACDIFGQHNGCENILDLLCNINVFPEQYRFDIQLLLVGLLTNVVEKSEYNRNQISDIGKWLS